MKTALLLWLRCRLFPAACREFLYFTFNLLQPRLHVSWFVFFFTRHCSSNFRGLVEIGLNSIFLTALFSPTEKWLDSQRWSKPYFKPAPEITWAVSCKEKDNQLTWRPGYKIKSKIEEIRDMRRGKTTTKSQSQSSFIEMGPSCRKVWNKFCAPMFPYK